MQRLAIFIGALVMVVAAAGAYLGANLMADHIERSALIKVETELNKSSLNWVSIRTDGLQVFVSGPAPDEAERFNALSLVNGLVNKNRVVDGIKVTHSDSLHPPRFALELLRNGDGISLIGLVPEIMGREDVLDTARKIDAQASVTDMLETADFPQPNGWKDAVEFGLAGLSTLPRSKISIEPGHVAITALAASQAEKQQIEARLSDSKPASVTLTLKISAPRPVITPFTLRLIKNDTGTRFDSCSADTEASVKRILAAARATGLSKDVSCAIGLGAPSPHWAKAVETAIHALHELGGGNLTFSDADVTLVAPIATRQVDFDRIVYNLEHNLPDVFSVHAILPPKPLVEGQRAVRAATEFLVTKSPEGLVQLRGRLQDLRAQSSVHNFAQATFGGDNVHDTTRIDAALPDGWTLRVLAGLGALGKLHNGSLTVKPHTLEIRGTSDRPEVSREVTQLLSEKLGDASRYEINITYQESLNRKTILPTPDECVASINAILATKQIIFAPSSAKIDGKSMDVIERIGEVMANCSEVPMEIGGHTDSQGREAMNLTLSQTRAEAVLDALLSVEVLTSFLSAKGYGETQPIADNKTEEGRKANRRIEFRLITAKKHSKASGNAGKTAAQDAVTDPKTTAAEPTTDPAAKTTKPKSGE